MERFPLLAGRLSAAVLPSGVLAAYALGIAVLIGSGPSQAQNLTGNPTKGKDLAGQLCAGCHVGDQNPGQAPTFEKIANTPHYTVERLRRIIALPPHRGMPRLSLTPAEIHDVAAYITSLRKPAK